MKQEKAGFVSGKCFDWLQAASAKITHLYIRQTLRHPSMDVCRVNVALGLTLTLWLGLGLWLGMLGLTPNTVVLLDRVRVMVRYVMVNPNAVVLLYI